MIYSKMSLWLGLALSGAAFSQGALDTDGDGTVSLQEFQSMSEERFRRLDSDGDGLLTTEELANRRRHGGRAELESGEIDTDGDGAISLPELQAVRPGMTEERFARMDANGDGLITSDERPQRRGGGLRGRDGRGGERRGADGVTL